MSPNDPRPGIVVLVVEDEPFIREDVMDVLEHEGFETLRAANVRDALAVLAARPDIRAVFTDIQMPGGVDGLDLARHLAEARPEIAVLVTSGRSYSAPDGMPPASRFLPKPYLPRTVARILREMVDAEAAPWDPGFSRSDGSRGSPAPAH